MMLGDLTIRPLQLHDIEPVAQLVAQAHTSPDGEVPAQYKPAPVRYRLNRSLRGTDSLKTLVAVIDEQIVGVGMAGPVGFAAATWCLSLGATKPEWQARGIGHALVQARLQMAREAGAGLIYVSTRNTERWRRYGFERGPVNPVSGAATMWSRIEQASVTVGGRA